MKHALVAGGAGFLGSHLCDLLLERGFKVTVVDNLITGYLENIAHNLPDPNFSLIKADVADPIHIGYKLDAVFHFASPSSNADYLQSPVDTLRADSLGTHNLLELAKEHNARFLLASTSGVYGEPLEHPQTEDYSGNVNPVDFESICGEARRFSEAVTMAYHRYHELDTRIARIFCSYGPGMRLQESCMVSKMIIQAIAGQPLTIFSDGSQIRSYCYMSDIIDGLFRLFESDIVTPVNIGNPVEISTLQLAETIIRLAGSKSEVVFQPLSTDSPVRSRPDITKARRFLNWEPHIDIEEGLARTIAYFERKLQSGSDIDDAGVVTRI